MTVRGWRVVPQDPKFRQLLRVFLLAAGLGIGIYLITPWVAAQLILGDYLGDYAVFGGIASAPIAKVYGEYGFPYPPTGLLLVRAFGGLPFWWAYAAWVTAGLAALSLAAHGKLPREALMLGLISHAGIAAIVSGQTSLFMAALILAGTTIRQPALSGVMLGVAAAIKPQALLAAPFAMLASRNYKGIFWAAAAGVAMLLLSLAIWGPELWQRWFDNLHRFTTYLQDRNLDAQDKGLYGLLLQLGLPGWLYVVAIPLGAICTWVVFRSEAGPVDRYAAFATSTILISPYTLGYDLAGLSIAAVALLIDKDRSLLTWIAAGLILTSVWANFGVILLAVALTAQWWRSKPEQERVTPII